MSAPNGTATNSHGIFLQCDHKDRGAVAISLSCLAKWR
ncbi:hypothetical protein [Azospirillum endophyticum]